jgi:hypothetical protein
MRRASSRATVQRMVWNVKKLLFGTLMLSVCAASAQAGTPVTTLHKRSETVIFGGIQWNFGASKPELVAGVRATQSSRTSNVTGVKFDVAIPLDSNTWTMPTFRAMGLAGSCDVQGELGLGWSFATNKPLFALGVQAPYSTAGINYTIANSFAPYVGVNTLRKPACAFKTTSGGSV